MVAALGQTSETPERLWNRSMYQAAAEEVAHLAAAARAAQASNMLRRCHMPSKYRDLHYCIVLLHLMVKL